MGFQTLYFNGQIGQQRPGRVHGFPQIQRNFVAEVQLSGGNIVGGGTIVEQQRGVDGHELHEGLRHWQAAAGIDGKGTAVIDKVPDGLQIPFGNRGIRGGQGAVIVNGQ